MFPYSPFIHLPKRIRKDFRKTFQNTCQMTSERLPESVARRSQRWRHRHEMQVAHGCLCHDTNDI